MTASSAELEVIVADRRDVADVVFLSLAQRDGGVLPGWQPGAHIALVVDGLVRYYSLTGDHTRRDRYEIAVRLDQKSTGGSQWIHDHVHSGSMLGIRLPRNNFPMVDAERYLFVAGGIGITPLYAMAIAASRAGSDWQLHYGAKSRATMVLLDELHDLIASTGVGSVLALPEDEVGLLPVDDFAEPRPGTQLYCCGPASLLDAVEDATYAWPADSIHVERYFPRQTPRHRPS